MLKADATAFHVRKWVSSVLPAKPVDQGTESGADSAIGIIKLATWIGRAELCEHLDQPTVRDLVSYVMFHHVPETCASACAGR